MGNACGKEDGKSGGADPEKHSGRSVSNPRYG